MMKLSTNKGDPPKRRLGLRQAMKRVGRRLREPFKKGVAWAMTGIMVAQAAAGAFAPVSAYAATAKITPVAENEFEDPDYTTTLYYDEITNESGWTEESNMFKYFDHSYYDPVNPAPDDLAGIAASSSGWSFAINHDTPKSNPTLRFHGGTYGSHKVDMLVTLTDWTYLEPLGGWQGFPEIDNYEQFTPGVFVMDSYRSMGEVKDKIGNINLYTVGLADVQVSVKWVFADTNDPIEIKGHMTCQDLDMNQTFSFDEAFTKGRVVVDNENISIVDGYLATTPNSSLSVDWENHANEYRAGLVGCYFDTTDDIGNYGKPGILNFGASWKGWGSTCQSFFAMTPDFLTIVPPDAPAEGQPEAPKKTADKTEGVSVGDEVEYTVEMTAHTQGVNCRGGYRYTALDIIDELPAEMRYVDGSGYLTDENGEVLSNAGEVIYEGENEDPTENTVRFEFNKDFLPTMEMMGEKYIFKFKAVLTEYPANGNLYVRNSSFVRFNGTGEYPSNNVDTELVTPKFSVDKVADKYEYEVGDIISYTVTYKQTAKNAQSRETVISDNLPEGLMLIADSVKATGIKDMPEPSINGNKWSYSFDKFNYGDTITVTYQARATSHGNGGEIVNNAAIHANNAMDADDPAEIWTNTAAVDVTKEADRYEGYVGASDQDPGFFEYTVHISNTKEGTIANNVVVTDKSLPEGMKVGRNNDGSMMIEVYEDGQKVDMSWKGAEANGSFKSIPYPVGAEDDVHNQTEDTAVTWDIEPAGTGWKMRINHLDDGHDIKIVYRAYPEDVVSGWEVVNDVDATADNSAPANAEETVWVNQPHFTIDKVASNDRFEVNDYVSYHVKVVNSTPGTIGRNVVISDLAHTKGVELDRSSIRVYDSRGNDITDSCTVEYKHNPYGAETFIVETHRDLVAGMTDDVADLYRELMETTTEKDFKAVYEKIRAAIEDGKGADHDSKTTLIPGRPVWHDGEIVWEEGSNPLGIDPDHPREGSTSCETEFVVEYRVKINDDDLAGQTVDNTAFVVSDEPNTGTTDDEVVDVKGAKLDVEKTSDKSSYVVGDTAHYTVTAKQTREAEGAVAKNVIIADKMSDPVLGQIVEGSVRATGPDGEVADAKVTYVKDVEGRIIGFTLESGVDLADEDVLTVTYDVKFETAGTQGENIVQASATNTVGDTDRNVVEVKGPRANVMLEKSVDKAELHVGDWATYTVTATVADNPAQDVVITDKSLPDTMPLDFKSITVQKNKVDFDQFKLDKDGNGFALELGDLAAGDVVTITYKAQARDESLAEKSVVNTVTLETPAIDEALRDDASVTVLADEPEVSFDKASDKDVVRLGESVEYTLTAKVGTVAVKNVRVEDASLPDGMKIDMSTIRAWLNGREIKPVNADIDGNAFAIDFGDLRAGEDIKVTYSATAEDEALVGTEVVNTATLAADNLDEPLKDSETVRVAGAGEAVLDKQADKSKVAAGDKLSYSVRAVAGVDTTDAVLTDKGLPAGVDIDTETIKVKINGKAANVEIKPEGTGFTIALGELKADDVVTVTYDATVSEDFDAASFENTATLTASEMEKPIEDKVTVEVEKDPLPTIDKTTEVEGAKPGDKISYTVEVKARRALTDAVLTDSGLGAEAEIDLDTVKVTVDGKAVDIAAKKSGDGFKLSMGEVEKGSVIKVSYDAVLGEDFRADTAKNTASLDAAELDKPVTDVVEVPVETPPTAEIEKTVDKKVSNVGDTVEYTVTATADGDMADAVLTDSDLPQGVEIDADTIAVSIDGKDVEVEPAMRGNSFTIELGDLADGAKVVATYKATVKDAKLAGTTADNTAALDSPDMEAPVEDTETIQIPATATPDDPDKADGPTLTKGVSDARPQSNTKVDYTVTATAGADGLKNAKLVDTPVRGIAIDAATVKVAIDGQAVDNPDIAVADDGTLTANLGDVAAGAEVEMTYTATIDADGTLAGRGLTNTVVLTGDGLEDGLTARATVTPTAPGKTLGLTGDALAGSAGAIVAAAGTLAIMAAGYAVGKKKLTEGAGE